MAAEVRGGAGAEQAGVRGAAGADPPRLRRPVVRVRVRPGDRGQPGREKGPRGHGRPGPAARGGCRVPGGGGANIRGGGEYFVRVPARMTRVCWPAAPDGSYWIDIAIGM